MTDPYVDSIGNRLDHPELVPPQYRHLIADDQQRVKRILEFQVSGRILDVGCSDGAITDRIAQRWNVLAVGADIRAHDTSDDRVCWDIRLPFPHREKPFDAIYACEVFEHLTDEEARNALANICAVLKPGGDLIVTVPNRHPADKYEIGLRSRWAWPDHRSGWTRWKLGQFLDPFFGAYGGWLETVPLYDGEREEDSIWIIGRAKGKR